MNPENISDIEHSKIDDKYGQLIRFVRLTDIAPKIENSEWSNGELKDKIISVVIQAGTRAIRENEGTIYTTLSGGIDSTLALSILRDNFPDNKIVTFTLGGSEEHPDIKYARLAAKRYGSEHHEYIPTPDDINEALDEFKVNRPEQTPEDAVRLGDFDIFLLYRYLAKFKPKSVIVHDGIDEQLGGYWDHWKESSTDNRREEFKKYWSVLESEHLDPLIKTAENYDIDLIFPYLDSKLLEYTRGIPVDDRVKNGVGKAPLRDVAKDLELPEEIINRKKRGAVGMTTIK